MMKIERLCPTTALECHDSHFFACIGAPLLQLKSEFLNNNSGASLTNSYLTTWPLVPKYPIENNLLCEVHNIFSYKAHKQLVQTKATRLPLVVINPIKIYHTWCDLGKSVWSLICDIFSFQFDCSAHLERYILLKTPPESDQWFQGYEHLNDSLNNRKQRKFILFSGFIFWLFLAMSSTMHAPNFWLILLDRNTYDEPRLLKFGVFTDCNIIECCKSP